MHTALPIYHHACSKKIVASIFRTEELELYLEDGRIKFL
jgi:hypothetical protein